MIANKNALQRIFLSWVTSGKKFKISWKTQGISFLKNVVTLSVVRHVFNFGFWKASHFDWLVSRHFVFVNLFDNTVTSNND